MAPVSKFGCIMIILAWLTLIFCFNVFADYNTDPTTGDYSMYQDVHVMVYVGFGFLMAFLYKNSLTTTAHSLVVAAFVTVWSMFNYWLWHNLLTNNRGGESWGRFRIGVDQLVNADFCAASILISFGVVVGRVSLIQLVVMAAFEVVFYSINEAIGYGRFGVADLGGSMIIHVFGAYFGITVALLLERTEDRKKKNEIFTPTSTHGSDTLAMIGTLFLWCFWPSFNSYFGGNINGGGVPQRAVVNTVLSLCSSTVVTVLLSTLIGKSKINIVDIQNATLAGGVAMGSSANMLCQPYGALIIGAFAGTVSTIGYRIITPFLERKIGLKDTCGVHNLHGMPGVIGGLASMILSANAKSQDYGNSWTAVWIFANVPHRSLIGYQLANLLLTLGIAILGGVFTAFILGKFKNLSVFYDDVCEFAEPEVEATNTHDHIQKSGEEGEEMVPTLSALNQLSDRADGAASRGPYPMQSEEKIHVDGMTELTLAAVETRNE